MTKLDRGSITELDWWINNVETSFSPISTPKPDIEMRTDASKEGYGSFCESEKAGGRWDMKERELHINVLELKAIENGLKSFEDHVSGKHVKIFTDNTVALCYVRDMGGKSKDCNDVAYKIWSWCIARNILLSITHIAGRLNTEADEKSRLFNDRTEWMLNPKIFKQISFLWGKPEV